MKRTFMLSSIFLFAVPYYLQAASTEQTASIEQTASTSQQGIIIGSMSEPVRTFEPKHYGNADFKLHEWGLGGLAICRRRAPTATTSNSRRLSVDKKILYDHVHTLRQLESGLIYKQFKDWDLLDIMQVNTWLNRLTDEQPGRLRDYDLPPLKLLDTEKDSQRIDMLLSQPLLMTEADRKWLNIAVHNYPEPATNAAKLEVMLQSTRESLIKIESTQEAQQMHSEIHVAACLHIQIASDRPWHSRGEETACILSNIVFMQHGVDPILFDDRDAYRNAVHRCLQQNNIAPLSGYLYKRIIESQEQKALKLLKDIKSGRL